MGKRIAYRIRYASGRDIPALMGLYRRSYPQWSVRNAKHDLRHTKDSIRGKRALVTVVNGEIVGYAFFGVVWNYMHLESSYVDPRYRRMGIGSAQLARRIGIARKMGLRKVISDCDVGNKAAYAYHLKNGFRKCGYVRRLFGRADSFVLSRDL